LGQGAATPSIAKSRNLKTAASKKRSVQSSATARRKVKSAATGDVALEFVPKSVLPLADRDLSGDPERSAQAGITEL
jgi:hypothetical protein